MESRREANYKRTLWNPNLQRDKKPLRLPHQNMSGLVDDMSSYQQHQEQQQPQQHQLIESYSLKVEYPSPPCSARSPVLASVGHSPDQRQLQSSHIVNLENCSSGSSRKRKMLENSHLEIPNVLLARNSPHIVNLENCSSGPAKRQMLDNSHLERPTV